MSTALCIQFLHTFAQAEHPVLWSMGTIWSLDRFILSVWPCGVFPTALPWGWSGCSHFNLPVIKKRSLQQLAWAPKSIITPSISRQTCSPLTDNVPSSIFMKVQLNYMLRIMMLISEIGLHFFLSMNYMNSRLECSTHAFSITALRHVHTSSADGHSFYSST